MSDSTKLGSTPSVAAPLTSSVAERLAQVVDALPDGILCLNRRWHITYANPAAIRITRLAPDLLSSGTCWELFPDLVHTEVQERLCGVMSSRQAGHCDFFYPPLDVHFDMHILPIDEGIALHFGDRGADHSAQARQAIAGHRASEQAEALRGQQAQGGSAELEAVYRTTPVGLALLDPVHFTFLNLNDQQADMLGFPKSHLLGRKLSEIAPPDRLPGLLELLREVAAGKHVRDHLLEGELAARPGDRRAWNVNYSPVYNEDGSIRAISSASVEVTQQKKAEAALIQSEKLAAVGRLASSISHEINNPLEAITNLLYLIAHDPQLPDTIRLYLQMAQSELARVSQIATQTLRFHRQAVAPTLVTPQELVGAVVQLYAGRLANSGIRVLEHYRTTTQILCFENDIRQIFNNLIANAIDAMRPGGGKLLIRAHTSTDYGVPEGRSGVRITVADTGHGMSPATLARVFEPFFTTKDLQGTGLGLWISGGLVERHQGRLAVRSSEDERHHGTLFTLFLPHHETPPPSASAPELSASSHSEPSFRTQNS